MEAKQKVLDTMKQAGQPLNAGKIAELSGLDRKEVDKAMTALKEEGAIVSPVRRITPPSPPRARHKKTKVALFLKSRPLSFHPQKTLTLNKPFKSIFHPKHFDAPIKVAIFVPKYTFSYTIVQIWQHSPHYTNIGYSHLMM